MSLFRDRLRFRLRWYAASRVYDKRWGRKGLPYALTFTWPRYSCHHRSRFLGLPCLREITWDGWCGLHNSTCHGRHDPDVNRCDGQLRDFDRRKARR